MDHAHRLSRSKLLPENLQVTGGMEYLPTQSRLLGVVNVDTGLEREKSLLEKTFKSKSFLKIQITRDRLVDNRAFENLYQIVRWALDFYATRETLRVYQEKRGLEATEPASDKLARIEAALEKVEGELDPETYDSLRRDVRAAAVAADAEMEERIRQSNLLGTLATAGISALSFQHELNKQFSILGAHLDKLDAVEGNSSHSGKQLEEIRAGLRTWLTEVMATRALFLNLSESENREQRKRLKATRVVESVVEQIVLLMHGIPIDYSGMDPDIRLPAGAFSEWSAIFQNVFLNAANALLDCTVRRIAVSTQKIGRTQAILVQDTGTGVDLDTAADLFEPFVRKAEISADRKALGYGGMGLGLTIVRMLARNLECNVGFVKPTKGFNTAFRLTWTDSNE